MNKTDIVYGMCVHGNNMASCPRCKAENIAPIDDSDLEEMKNEINKVFHSSDFNEGVCQETCNCIEIAENRNGGDPVKNYPCLNGAAMQEITKPFKPS